MRVAPWWEPPTQGQQHKMILAPPNLYERCAGRQTGSLSCPALGLTRPFVLMLSVPQTMNPTIGLLALALFIGATRGGWPSSVQESSQVTLEPRVALYGFDLGA